MPTTGSVRTRSDQSDAPYWRSIRHSERMIIRNALETFNGDLYLMADMLGVPSKWLKDRIYVLGGCLPDQPINEPPLESRYNTKRPRELPEKAPAPRLRPTTKKKRNAKLRDVDPPAESSVDGPDHASDEGARTSADLHDSGN